ncbi:hypothetical protein CE91St52_05970 [Phascolarctobacterium faecium]|uniref:glycine-rich domain-containing protein n=1 Tax=Phascolarctobacterium faecium TaxID=33025 RepID=UPI001FCBEF61|nr:hypothetical protein [Phascolarctobacterium faecium]BDE83820.1 hypothetical protein CE91St52_05970 [Phascolarctobacterium faecium]BDE92945.1 hypothetical protein CE91St53_05970 [Phascolarctobacterium faecium]
MAELAKKLYFKKAGVEQTAKAYSTTAEVGAEYIENKIDGVTCYVAIGDTTNSRATVGLVKKSSTSVDQAILDSGKPPYNKIEYRTPGTYTITIPAGATAIQGEIAGAGGGGAGNNWVNDAPMELGGNGGSGELITQKIAVTPLSTLTIIVGAGGAGGSYWGRPGGAGGSSSIVNFITARGGGGGLKDNKNGTSYGNGGSGGLGGKRTDWGEDGKAGSPGWVIIEYGGDI